MWITPTLPIIIQEGEDEKRTFEIEQLKRQQNGQDSQDKDDKESHDKK